MISSRNNKVDKENFCNTCEIPYCCFFKKDDGALISSFQTLRIVKKYPWINYNFSKYFTQSSNGSLIYQVRTRENKELKENPLSEINEQFGNYPCVFLKFDLLEEKYRCSIYDERPLACALFYCKEL
jgi:Fe-S-cluster containining protein